MKFYVKHKDIAVPGQLLAEGMDVLPSSGTFRKGDKVLACKYGLVEIRDRVIKVIPLSGVYIPNKGDMIIGKVTEVGFAGWLVDIGSPYSANLPIGEAVKEKVDLLTVDISKFFDIGDLIFAKVLNVTKSKIIQLSMKENGRKLIGGRIVKITPTKVPRVIGKKGSMINLLKEKSGCNILVGQNGWIWIKGKPEAEFKVTHALYMIEKESHISGLTDKIKKFLEGA